jgi:predicted dehydrogenase
MTPAGERPRVLVLGAGSIGTRHTRNLMVAGAHVTVADPDVGRARSAGADGSVAFDGTVPGGYDGVVVASPTREHGPQALAALDTDAKVLVEKPVTAELDDLDRLVKAGADRLMVGYNLRFHEPVARLVGMVGQGRAGRVRSLRLWFGSWLPDWRPAVDYRQTYSARRELGGGVLNDAIHELDLLCWLVPDGDLTVAGAVVDRLGPLDIDVEDTVKAVIRAGSGPVAEISLDYLSRRYRRGIEVVGDDATIRLDWSRAVLEIEDAEGVESQPAQVPVDRSYEAEARAFLAFVTDDVPPPVDAAGGARSVRLAHAIRTAAR